MKDLLDRIRELRLEPDEDEIQRLLAIPVLSIPMLEAMLVRRKAEQREILTGSLLEWMQENDQVTFETDEEKVTISTYVSAKVEDADTAFKWLEDEQYGDLIKDTLDFPKGELTPDIEDMLELHGVSYAKKSGIHPQSLKKVMSDRLKDGDTLPTEDEGFLINYFDECKVKAK